MNGPDLSQYGPPLLAIAGGALQWLRAWTHFREWGYHLMAVALAGFTYFLLNNPHGQGWRLEVILALLGVSSYLTSLYGGTFLMSNAAKGMVEAATTQDMKIKTAANPLVPLTNSK